MKTRSQTTKETKIKEFLDNFISRKKGNWFCFDIVTTAKDHLDFSSNELLLVLSQEDYLHFYNNINEYLDLIEKETEFNYFSVSEKENGTFCWLHAGICTTSVRWIKIKKF